MAEVEGAEVEVAVADAEAVAVAVADARCQRAPLAHGSGGERAMV